MLRLRNFKGVTSFVLECDRHVCRISGDNGTGKTTLMDAFVWLVRGTDSLGRTDFQIKTLDAAGAIRPGIEHEAECLLSLDGTEIKLRKVYKERWTKRRGSAKSHFRGNKTDYFINDVPVKMSEYQRHVINLFGAEETFRTLMIPEYFGAGLDWQDRRDIIMELCGALTDEQVLARGEGLKELQEDLKNYSVDDLRKIIAAKKAKVNEELRSKPLRIDECWQQIDQALDESGDVAEGLQLQVTEVREQIAREQRLVADAQSGGLEAAKVTELRTLEAEALEITTRLREANLQGVYDIQSKLAAAATAVMNALPNLTLAQNELTELQEKLTKATKSVETSNDWFRELKEKGPADTRDSCFACGHKLEEDDLEESRGLAKQHFAEQLRAAADTRDQWVAQAAYLKDAENPKALKAVAVVQQQNVDCRQAEATLRSELEEAEKRTLSPLNDPDFVRIVAAKNKVQDEILGLRQDGHQVGSEHEAEVARLQDTEAGLLKRVGRMEAQSSVRARITKLENEQRELVTVFEGLEHTLRLVETFTRLKVELVEGKVNEMFQLARFKLFDVQINGAVLDCCEVTYKGVPYSDLNHGARINVGIDIIETLAQHYGLSVPIWIDGAEAITEIRTTPAQQIQLYVARGVTEMLVL